MILILFLISSFITFYSYHNSKLGFLSPTFWASFMFMAFSFLYCITFFSMRSDISILTGFAIVTFLVVTALGEYIGTRITIKHSNLSSDYSQEIDNGTFFSIKKWKIIIVTILFMVVAVDRYRNLRLVAASYAGGNISGIMEMMTYARLAFVNSNSSLELSGTFFNQLVYMCEITSYIVIFMFMYNLIKCKRKDWYLLLPVVPDLFIRFLSTSRTSFILLVIAILVIYFTIMMKNTYRKVHISPKIYTGIILFVCAFMIYGRIRNDAGSIPVVNYLQMYTCSSLYGLHDLFEKGWNKNPYFGFYTMQNVYSLLGIEHDVVKTWGSMVTFSKSGIHANLYTSLADPIRDFGIAGMLLVRLFCSIIASFIIKNFKNISFDNKKLLVSLYFVIVLVYCYVYSATGDVFADYFLNFSLMLRYFVYSIVLVYYFYKPVKR